MAEYGDHVSGELGSEHLLEFTNKTADFMDVQRTLSMLTSVNWRVMCVFDGRNIAHSRGGLT